MEISVAMLSLNILFCGFYVHRLSKLILASLCSSAQIHGGRYTAPENSHKPSAVTFSVKHVKMFIMFVFIYVETPYTIIPSCNQRGEYDEYDSCKAHHVAYNNYSTYELDKYIYVVHTKIALF